MPSNCEECVWYDYDDELDAYVCEAELDEDEMERFLRAAPARAPSTAPATTTGLRDISEVK